MDNYIIRDTKHFLFWDKENKKDTTIFDDIVEILEDRIKILQDQIINNTDVCINIDLNRELCQLESKLDRFIDKTNTIDEIFVDINDMFCTNDNVINITKLINDGNIKENI